DFSSALLQAQSSKAKVIGLANAGADTQNSIKQAAEFGIVRGGQKLAGLLVFINGVDSHGLELAPGTVLTTVVSLDPLVDARVGAASLPAHEPHAEHGTGGNLFIDHALSEGGGGRRH